MGTNRVLRRSVDAKPRDAPYVDAASPIDGRRLDTVENVKWLVVAAELSGQSIAAASVSSGGAVYVEVAERTFALGHGLRAD